MGINDVKKENKLEPVTDVSELMNKFINKITQIVSSPQFIEKNDLLEVRDILSSLKQIDKTVRYTIFPNTVANVKKAMQEVGYEDIESVKELNSVREPLDRIFKLEENELPGSDKEAKEKYNDIVNTQIDQTIKTINEIVQPERPNPEGLTLEELGQKIIRELFVGLLSMRLKELNDLALPIDKSNKILGEIDLNEIQRGNKLTANILESGVKNEKSFSEIEESENKTSKELDTVEEPPRTQKIVFGLGEFPDFSNKLANTVRSEITKREKLEREFEAPDSTEKSLSNAPLTDEKSEKTLNNVRQAESSEKSIEDINLDNTETEKERQIIDVSADKLLKEQVSPDTAEQVDKTVETVSLDTSQLLTSPNKKVEPQEVTNPPWANRKKGVVPWYEVLTGQRQSGESNLGITGINEPVLELVGSALALFGISKADVTRYANSVTRSLNTAASGLAISSALSTIFLDQKVDGSKPGIGDPRLLTQADLKTTGRPEGARAEFGSTVTKNFDYENYWERVDKKGESSSQNNTDELLTENQLLTTKVNVSRPAQAGSPARVGSTTVERFSYSEYWKRIEKKILFYKDGGADAAYSGLSNTGSVSDNRLNDSNFQIDKEGTVAPEGKNVGSQINFKERTVEIVSSKKRKGTGFLKIYLRRGPGFADSQSQIEIIPFQFEPVISGDSKSADYAQISTLARSQAAQVYRRSQERNITLNLEYVVTGPSTDQSAPGVARTTPGGVQLLGREEAISKSSEGMALWDEDYIYGYIIRNFRNLTLPNIIGQGYKLAPPIVQVWYGGLDNESQTASSTGLVTDPNNTELPNIHPALRTNWYTADGKQSSYRALWVCKSVSFEYKGGIINRISRHNVQVSVSLQLTEIAPSVTANEILLWRKIAG